MSTMLLYINLIILSLRLKTLETKYELRNIFSTLVIYNITTLSWVDYNLIKLILMYSDRIVSDFIVNRRFLSQRKSP